jgi:hypothetical protein
METRVFPLLLNYLPQCVRLKKLTILWEIDDTMFPNLWATPPNEPFLRTLQQNGSLQRIEFLANEAPSMISDRLVLRRVRAILERNRLLPQLVQPKSEDVSKNLALFPTLFNAVKQAPRTAPNTIFLGVCALRMSICDGKRKRPYI